MQTIEIPITDFLRWLNGHHYYHRWQGEALLLYLSTRCQQPIVRDQWRIGPLDPQAQRLTLPPWAFTFTQQSRNKTTEELLALVARSLRGALRAI